MKYYDASQQRLIYIREKATADFWDNQWKDIAEKRGDQTSNKGKGKHSSVVRITQKYLRQEDGLILEGGCGLGGHVRNLTSNGFSCIGVDYAKDTVEHLNAQYPELNIQYGDIRKLPFEDSCFVGYWSLGVIEHFWEGYQDITKEMHRVIKPGGVLFLSFPYMNLLRRVKAKMGLYELYCGTKDENYYQFALNKKAVINDFLNLGFNLVKQSNSGVLFGMKDELGCGNVVESISKLKDKNIFTKVMYYASDRVLNFFLGSLLGHTTLLVFKR